MLSDLVSQPRRIAILGSTGSIGRQTVDVIKMHSDIMRASVLVANTSARLIAEQALALRPDVVVIADETKFATLKDLLDGADIEVLAGPKAIEEVVTRDCVDVVVAAMVGFSGFAPTMSAIRAGKEIALANKETLVVAGELVMAAAAANGVRILPVDSEHSAIFQCLNGERHIAPDKIILTASGGPFRGRDRAFLSSVTPAMALRHPNWSMGAKVTVDSASMMNKGLEAIEAHWLFDMPKDKIDILVHPQSIVHSMVEFPDGAIKAQLGVADMRLPIQYALTYPDRLPSPVEQLDFSQWGTLTFEKPDLSVFQNLRVALDCLEQGGNAPCVMNGANEVAVEAFLKEKISFTRMTDVVETALAKCRFIKSPSMSQLYESDSEARRVARDACEAMG